MLGRKYQDAFSIFDHSVHSQPSLNESDSSPIKRSASHEPRMSPTPFGSPISDRFRTPQNHQPDVLTLQPPAQPTSGLPPTPPSNMQGTPQEIGNDAPVHADSVVSSLMSQKSSLNTPVNQRSPPTPETTPPQDHHHLSVSRPSLVSHTPSSFAGSFRTAREQQSIDEGESNRYVPSEASTQSFSGNWSHSAGRCPGQPVPEIGLGLNFEYMAGEGTSAESTPRERYPEARDEDDSNSRYAAQHRNGYMHDPEWDSDRMRNVTLRKRQPKATVTTSPNRDSSTPEIPSPSLREKAKESAAQNGRSSISPDMTKFARDSPWSSPVRNQIQAQQPQEERKRLSSASNSSTVVEAVVLATPAPARPQHRVLRRMGKNISLRDGHDTESHFRPASQTSKATSSHHIMHEKSPNPERRSRASNGLIVSSRAVSSPKRISPDSNSIMSFPQPPSAPRISGQRSTSIPNTGSLLKQLPPGLDRVGLGYFDIAQGRAPFASGTPRRSEDRPRDSISFTKTPTRSNEASSSDSQDAAAHASFKFTPREASQQQPFVEDVNRSELSAESRKGWSQSEHDEELLSDEPGLPIMGTRVDKRSTLDRGTRSTSLNNSPNIRAQLDQPRASRETISVTRISSDHLLDPNSDHSLARYIHASASPHSEGSTEQPDSVEVSQATAVSIYPHNNNSLLVVQQLARPATSSVIEHRRTTSSIRSGASTSYSHTQSQPGASFTATIVPSTPPTNADARPASNSSTSGSKTRSPQHLSPLQTQSHGPKPPVFKLIPPTPLSEIDSPLSLSHPNASVKVAQLTGPGVPTNASLAIQNTPSRRLSLRQRARRLSEPIIQPLLQAKAQLPLSTNKNRYDLQAHPPSVPSISDIPQESNKLHPFWRPRGFWNDFSDSEDEEFMEDEEPGFFVAGRHVTSHAHVSPFTPFDPEVDRLPEGGDTSNARSPLPTTNLLGFSGGSLSRRIGSLRSGFAGAGGFLIGNSLGIGRQPSNSRWHVVQLPASLRAKLASPDGVQKRRSLSTGSIPEGNLHSASLRRAQRQRGFLHRTRWGVRNKKR